MILGQIERLDALLRRLLSMTEREKLNSRPSRSGRFLNPVWQRTSNSPGPRPSRSNARPKRGGELRPGSNAARAR